MRASEAQVEAVRRLVAPVVAGLGCTLYDVELRGAGPSPTLRVTLDRPGGVDLDTVAEATRAIAPALDDAADLAGPYLLEVSSPGVERALRRPEHFRGALGETVTVKYRTDAGPRRARGRLVAADDERVVVDAEGEEVAVAYCDVTQARTVFEWGPPARPGRAGRGRARAKEKA